MMDKAHRKLINSFLGQRAARALPEANILDYYFKFWVHYKPDSDDIIIPVEWECKEDECYTYDQAIDFYRQTGGE